MLGSPSAKRPKTQILERILSTDVYNERPHIPAYYIVSRTEKAFTYQNTASLFPEINCLHSVAIHFFFFAISVYSLCHNVIRYISVFQCFHWPHTNPFNPLMILMYVFFNFYLFICLLLWLCIVNQSAVCFFSYEPTLLFLPTAKSKEPERVTDAKVNRGEFLLTSVRLLKRHTMWLQWKFFD